MKTSMRLFFVLVGLPLINAQAQPDDIEKDIVRSVIYDSEPEYIEKELELYVERILALLSECDVDTPEHHSAAYIAAVAILDRVQQELQQIAAVKPAHENNWSGQAQTGWLRATRMTREALFSVAYFSDMRAREAVSSILQNEAAPRWLDRIAMAKEAYERESQSVTYGLQRQTLLHRLIERQALYFIQDHARQLFHAAYPAALADLKEEDGAHPFQSTKSMKWFRDKYLSDFACGAAPFITILLGMFESRVWK